MMKKWLCFLTALTLLVSLCAAAWGEISAEPEAENAEEEPIGCMDLAADGTRIWQAVQGTVRCTEISTGERIAEMPLAELLPQNDKEFVRVNIVSRKEGGALLCTVLQDANESVTTELHDLAVEGGQIVLLGSRDVTGTMEPFFGNDAEWMEVDLVACAGGLFMTALDQDTNYNFFLYDPDNGTVKELGQQTFLSYSAAVPCGDRIVLAGLSQETENAIDLTLLDPEDGSMSLLCSVVTGTTDQALGYAWDPESNKAFFMLNSTAYRFPLESGAAAEPFAVYSDPLMLTRLGAVAAGKYVLMTENEELVSIAADNELAVTKLTISNMSGLESVSEAARQFNAANPEYLVSVTEGGDENKLLEAMLNQNTDYDAWTMSMDISVFRSLRDRGYLTDLSGSSVLDAAVADMPENIRENVIKDGRLVAMPLNADCGCLIVNTQAAAELAGISREEVPTDWVGFLELLAKLADERALENSDQYCLSDEGSADILREQVFSWILRDAYLWLDEDESRKDSLNEVLLPVLQAYDKIKWDQFGLPDDAQTDMSWFLENEKIPLLSEALLELSVVQMTEGSEYWPLSLQPGGKRAIPESVSVMIVNPYSPHRDVMMKFIESAWEGNDILAKMSLCQSMNEPVINTSYNEDIAYFESMIPVYEGAIAATDNEGEAEALREEMEDMKAFMAEYKEKAYWLASEESIAAYRKWSELFVPAAQAFLSLNDEDTMVLQYLDGMISADMFVSQLISTLQMSQMEGY